MDRGSKRRTREQRSLRKRIHLGVHTCLRLGPVTQPPSHSLSLTDTYRPHKYNTLGRISSASCQTEHVTMPPPPQSHSLPCLNLRLNEFISQARGIIGTTTPVKAVKSSLKRDNYVCDDGFRFFPFRFFFF